MLDTKAIEPVFYLLLWCVNIMKTIVSKTNIYEYHELNEYGQRKAVENFVKSKTYQYSYAWSDEKRIRTIINDKMYFTYTGDIVPT